MWFQCLAAGYDLPPHKLTPEEVEAIVVGLSLIGRTGDSDLSVAAFATASSQPSLSFGFSRMACRSIE